MNWLVILTMIARLGEQKKLPLKRKKQWKTQSRRQHPQSSSNDPGASSFLPTPVKNLPNSLSTGQHHYFRGYEGRPQSYPVRKGSCHACRVFSHWRHEFTRRSNTSDHQKMATLTQHSSRVHNKNPYSSNNKNNLKKTGPLKVENMKDKYDYVSGKKYR